MQLSAAPIQEPITRDKGLLTEIWVKWLTLFSKELYKAKPLKVSQLPALADIGALVFVSDEAGGATIAFFDGTNWRRVQDRQIVS